MRRSKPLARRTALKRQAPREKPQKRVKLGKAAKPQRTPLKKAARRVIDRQAAAAWAKGVRNKPCAVCGKTKKAGVTVRGHHVLRQQMLTRTAKAIARASGEDAWDVEQRLLWDPRNRMAVCDGCHNAHHHPGVTSRRIPLAKVLAAAPKVLQMVRELGAEAETELRREYST